MKIIAPIAAVIGVLIAVFNPGASGQAARIYLIVVAGLLGLLATRILLQPPPAITASRFNPTTVVHTTPELPEEFRRIKALLSHYNTAKSLPSIDPITRHLLRTITEQRLYHRHQLRLGFDAHAAAVRSLLSPTLWAVVAPPSQNALDTESAHHAVPSEALPALIDEVERL
jgi:hypothetical protein